MSSIRDILNRPLGSGGSKAPGYPDPRSRSSVPKASRKKAKPMSVAGEHVGLQSKASRAGKALVYVLTGLVAACALAGMLAFLRPAPAAPKATNPGISSTQQRAGAYAVSLVGAWLSSSSADHAALDAFVKNGSLEASGKEPIEYRDLVVASVEKTETTVTKVTLSASVKTITQDSTSNKPVTTWTPSWFAVSIEANGDQMAPQGYPIPVSMPRTTSPSELPYTKTPTSPELSDTVSAFIAAYAAGTGDMSRYISPDSTITAISPSFFTESKILGLKSTQDIKDGAPKNDQTAEVLVNVVLKRSDSSMPASYALTLRARDGRWEVVTIAPAGSAATSH